MKSFRFEWCLFFLAFLAFSGCSPDEKFVYENPPVGVLESNEYQITLHTGPEGPLYSVKGPDGKRLATEISPDELQASFPNLNVEALWSENSAILNLIDEARVLQIKETEYPLIMEPFPVEPLTHPR